MNDDDDRNRDDHIVHRSTPQCAIAVKVFKREFGVLGPKTNKRELHKIEKCLKKIEKRLNFLSENSVFWGPKLRSNYSRQLRSGEYLYFHFDFSEGQSI